MTKVENMNDATRQQLIIEEYKSVLERHIFIRKDIAYFEAISFAAIFGYASWLLSDAPTREVYSIVLYLVPAAIGLYSKRRLEWRIRNNRIIESYLQKFERFIYAHGNLDELNGYENFYSDQKTDFSEQEPGSGQASPRHKIYDAIIYLSFLAFIIKLADFLIPYAHSIIE
ncbi:MAG: hypothetical protein AAFX04_13050 [Pseudomonadota bacterium]